ncbi:MAG: hypothetical protein KatS3mg027_1202 [Bacteroidia bacterium]|nr:MAG: hypothetical protein KatS3mg027_1202 [Bacteroidia bacterium]
MKKFFLYFFVVCIGAFILLFDAFYNGFPIVYSDTSTYLSSGFELETPFDRPIMYGLFVRVFSLNGISLWFVVFTQAFILSLLIFLLTKEFFDSSLKQMLVGLLLITFITAFTGVSWVVSQVMPDIFTSIGLLALMLILSNNLNKLHRVILYFIYFLSLSMHMSHLMIFSGIILVLYFSSGYLPFKNNQIHKFKIKLLVLFSLTVLSFFTMNSSVSKSKHAFIMGAMLENGVLKPYLDEYCGKKLYKLCEYKDSLPDRAYKFLWDEDSPFYKLGGWKNTRSEFNLIIYDILTTSKYILLTCKASLTATLLQLQRFKVGDGNGKFDDGTLLFERIRKYFNDEHLIFKRSLQNQEKLFAFIKVRNIMFYTITLISAIGILISFFLKHYAYTFKFHVFTIFSGVLINAWCCGTFANAIDRLGCKMMWLIVLMSGLILLKKIYSIIYNLNYSNVNSI